nr:hypothetical protein [uncultured Lichenicoccus sp.]
MRLLGAARDRLVQIVRRQPAPSRYYAAAHDETLRAAARLTPYCMLTSGMVALVLLPNLGIGPASYRYGLTAIIEIVVALAFLTSWRSRRALRGGLGDRQRDTQIRMLVGLSFTLGVAWSTMPVMLFGPADASMRVMIACTCAGLIATSVVMMPIFAASEALAIPLILGSFIALHRTGIVLFQWLAVLLGIYAVFIILASNAIRLLFERYTLMRLQQDDQQDIIQLLLGDVDQRVSRWLWETDAEGRLRFVTPRPRGRARAAGGLGRGKAAHRDRAGAALPIRWRGAGDGGFQQARPVHARSRRVPQHHRPGPPPWHPALVVADRAPGVRRERAFHRLSRRRRRHHRGARR